MPREEIYVLDSTVLKVFLNNGPGKEELDNVFRKKAQKKGIEILVTVLDLGKVYQESARLKGYREAKAELEKIEALPVNALVINKQIALEAAELALEHGLEYTEAVACALAFITGGTLVTANPSLKKAEGAVRLLHLS